MVRGRIGGTLALAAAMAAFLLPAGTASAGRLLATGHDADSHCSTFDSTAPEQCHFLKVAVDYVRGGAPTPSNALLLLDCSTPASRLATAIKNAGFGIDPGQVAVICPTNPAFANEPLTTAKYSAIVVGSSLDQINIGTGNDTPDSNAIARRKAAIQAFFNAGGGILALSADANGDGNPLGFPETYYSFLPIPLGGKAVTSPFRLTPEGQQLGFQDSIAGIGTSNDINCCPTHNSFQEPPPGSALKVVERDSSVPPAPETLIAEGKISGGTITNQSGKPTFGKVVKLPSNKKCVSRRRFRIKLRQPGGVQIQTALVFVNGQRVRTVKRKIFKKLRTTARVDLRGLPKGTFFVRIVVLTTKGQTLKGTRKYKTCRKKKFKPKRPPKL
jgi:hypothetical protein